MEEYTQVTLNEWMEWKEDIRRKLAETAQNFVYIGYRLKQIRDSGMFDGCQDIFEFALKEYGLGKSTVSRFIAINEKFSEGGNSLELKAEYRAIGSSKLAEMLTLSDSECQLITERTTVKEIRELKQLSRQQAPEDVEGPDQYTPLQKCIIAFFGQHGKRETLNKVMMVLMDAPDEEGLKEAAELINPGEYATFKKGIIFLFLYDYKTGVKYKSMMEPEPVSMSWVDFLRDIMEIYHTYCQPGSDTWVNFYGEPVPEPKEEKQEEKKAKESEKTKKKQAVATSQQKQEKVLEKGKGQEVKESEKESLSDDKPLQETSGDGEETGGGTDFERASVPETGNSEPGSTTGEDGCIDQSADINGDIEEAGNAADAEGVEPEIEKVINSIRNLTIQLEITKCWDYEHIPTIEDVETVKESIRMMECQLERLEEII